MSECHDNQECWRNECLLPAWLQLALTGPALRKPHAHMLLPPKGKCYCYSKKTVPQRKWCKEDETLWTQNWSSLHINMRSQCVGCIGVPCLSGWAGVGCVRCYQGEDKVQTCTIALWFAEAVFQLEAADGARIRGLCGFNQLKEALVHCANSCGCQIVVMINHLFNWTKHCSDIFCFLVNATQKPTDFLK